jgi:hypothetical protein
VIGEESQGAVVASLHIEREREGCNGIVDVVGGSDGGWKGMWWMEGNCSCYMRGGGMEGKRCKHSISCAILNSTI